MEDLREWFRDGSLERLLQVGFGVFPYEAQESLVRIGGRQAVFVRESAVRLGEMKDIR